LRGWTGGTTRVTLLCSHAVGSAFTFLGLQPERLVQALRTRAVRVEMINEAAMYLMSPTTMVDSPLVRL